MDKDTNLYGVILAGGSGSRLWPLSRQMYPKQLLKLHHKNTLFQSTFAFDPPFNPSISGTTAAHPALNPQIKGHMKHYL